MEEQAPCHTPRTPTEPLPLHPQLDSLDLPRYGATFGEAFKLFFKKYGTFDGRASRSEYWWVMLLNALVTMRLRCPHGRGRREPP